MTKNILERVYHSIGTSDDPDYIGNPLDAEEMDPESHLYFINAFEMPLWNYSHERNTFEMWVSPQVDPHALG